MRLPGRSSADGVSCRELVESITAFLDGELEPRHRAAIVGHLAGCAGCVCALEQFQRTIGALGAISTDDVAVLDEMLRADLIEAFLTSRNS